MERALVNDSKTLEFIPYGRQNISEEDIQAVVDVLRSDFLTQGQEVPKFEKLVCDYVKVKHALAVNSGTSALHVACLALGLGDGDWLWTTPTSFVASSNCGLYCGAKVDFVDIDPSTWNLSIGELKRKLILAKPLGKLPKILVAVHLQGLPCEMKVLKDLANEFGFAIIEDASHAIGGVYSDKPIGCCEYSDITVFSFHPVKTVTTGEGGMAVTNCQDLATKMDLFRSHGITRDQNLMRGKETEENSVKGKGPWDYHQLCLGYNYRLTDIQATLGSSQLKRLKTFSERRREIAEYYQQQLNGLPLQLPVFSYDSNNVNLSNGNNPKDSVSGLHLYVVRLNAKFEKNAHLKIFEFLRKNGIGVNLHYVPIHDQPYYQDLGFKLDDFPEAVAYSNSAISLPMYPDLTKEKQDRVIDTLIKALKI